MTLLATRPPDPGWAPPDDPTPPTDVATPPRRRPAVLAVAVGLALAVSIGFVLTRGASSEADPRLLVRDERGTVSLVDPERGTTEFGVEGAVPSGDRSRLFTVDVDDGGTRLDAIDAATGTSVASLSLPGALAIRAVAPRGSTVALMPEDGTSGDAYAPVPRETTRITVVDAESDLEVTRRLDGNYEPEIFSTDGGTLFLLEYWPPLEADRYFVRQLDVASGQIADVYSPEVDLQPEMRGTARAQVMAPDGSFLYTLYTLPRERGVHDPAATPGESERWAFVHALDLDEEWSICIFLPLPFGTAGEESIDLAIAPDGDTLVVADAATAKMAFVDTGELAVTDVGSVPQLRADAGRPLLALGHDRTVFLSLGWSIVALDGERFEADAAWLYRRGPGTGATEVVSDLDMAPDGSQLRVAVGDEIVTVDPVSGTATGAVSVGGAGGDGAVTFVGPPDGSIVDIPVECAC